MRSARSFLSDLREHMRHRISHVDMDRCNYMVFFLVDTARHVDTGRGHVDMVGMLTWSGTMWTWFGPC